MKTTIFAMFLSIAALPASLAFAAPPAPKATAADTVSVVATCKDGYQWKARNGKHQGACARHGGVATYTDGSTVKTRGPSLNPRNAK